MSHPLFDHQNAGYVQLLYEEYSKNPDSVPEAWQKLFRQGPAVAEEAGLLIPDTLPGTPSAPVPSLTQRKPAPPTPQVADAHTRALLPVVARAAGLVRELPRRERR